MIFVIMWWHGQVSPLRAICQETTGFSAKEPGPRFNIKMSSYQYRKSHCGDKTVVRSSYVHNGISYTGKMSSLYWIGTEEFRALLVALFLVWTCFWKKKRSRGKWHETTLRWFDLTVLFSVVMRFPHCQWINPAEYGSSHCGLLTTFGVIELDQHLFR